MEALHRDYSPKGVRFFYVYKALAHPELRGYVTPYTLEERLAHVQEARRKLRTQIPWIVDAMDNRIKHAFGDRPNSEFLIDPQGIVLVKRAWSDPAALRRDLERIVGPVEDPTDPAELHLGTLQPRTEQRPPELPRIELPEGLVPVRVQPHLDGSREPFYAKLRVEVQRSVLRSGTGQVYFDLRLDPLYNVHWNNLVGPVKIVVGSTNGVELDRRSLVAPQPKQESDGAPREFLVQASDAQPGGSFEVTVYYAACHDEEGWCKILEQKYTVVLTEDRDAGRVIRRGNRPRPRAARTAGHLVHGTVERVADDQLVLRTVTGDTIKLRLTPGTYAMSHGKRVPLERVRAGQRVAVRVLTTRATQLARYVLVLSAED